MEGTPTASLESPRAKLKRAHVHLKALYTVLEAFAADETHETPIEYDGETGEHVARLRIIKPLDNPAWGLLVGDFLTNLRATLDHLVWQLVILSGQKPGAYNQFPISLNGRRYWSISKNGESGARDRMLKGVSDEFRALIDNAQPYRAHGHANRHPLAVINALCNADKHHAVHAAYSYVPHDFDADATIQSESSEPGAYSVFSVSTGPLEDGAEIVRMRNIKPSDDAKMNVKASFPMEIAFGKPGTSAQNLNMLFVFVRDLLRAYRPHFGEPPSPGPLD